MTNGPWGGPRAGGDPPPEAAAPVHLTRTDFAAAIARNKRNTEILCAVLTLVGVVLGAAVGWTFPLLFEAPLAVANKTALGAAAFMLVFSLVWTLIATSFGDRMVLGLTGAREIPRDEAPVLHNVVEEMAIAAGLPKPRVAIVETEALNAFATGTRPDNAAIAVTRGLLNQLNRDELQGVVAHEMGHVANNDVLYMTSVGVLVGLIVVVSELALRGARFSRSGSSSRKSGGGLVIVAIIVLVAIGLLSPLAARAVQMAVSRQREFMADATSVKLTRNPLGLIGALRKLDQAPVRWDTASKAVQHLFIVNPFKKFGEKASALMATHPSVEQRIQRLQNLG
ncbi:MAG: M48 family metallopeptidase [Rhodospirillales bacterium]|nr:M48 family metallopeptidase [Rhodospirillales bacterium]